MTVVVVAGDPGWLEEATAVLGPLSIPLKQYQQPGDDVARLAQDHAAMLLVDEAADWRYWITVAKTSPATRRIPVVVVASDESVGALALAFGADAILPTAVIAPRLPELLFRLARLPDPARQDELRSQCQEPLPPEAREGIAQLNAGHYYRQHDLFEALWMAEAGPVRDLYRAILQVGVAYYQVTRGNRSGAIKMLLRSLQWLAVLPECCQGVDVKRLREDSARVWAALEQADDLRDFDRALLQPVRLVEPPV